MVNFSVLQSLNVLSYVGFTAANVYAFILTYVWKGYAGKLTLLSPQPWLDIIILVVHVLFIGTLAYAQWSERGRDMVIGGLNYRWPALMFLSIFWTLTWLHHWVYTSWMFALVIALLAVETSHTLKRRYRLQYEISFKEELLVHIPFSFFESWALLIFIFNSFVTFAPVSEASGLKTKILAVWCLILISGIAFYSAFSYASGDIFLALNLAFGQFAVFAGQIVQKNTNDQHVIAWFAFASAIISVWAAAYSAWLTSHIVRHGAGSVRLEENADAEEH